MNLDEISDNLEIERLMAKYVDAIDGKDWDLLDEVFTDDAYLDYESSGGPDGKGEYLIFQNCMKVHRSQCMEVS